MSGPDPAHVSPDDEPHVAEAPDTPEAHDASEATADNETARIEAFSDGVFAIAITLLVLEIKVPHHIAPGELAAELWHAWPSWVALLISFASIAIMWVNHHRLFSLIQRSDDGLLFYNSALLLAVTIVPFPTAVIAEHLRGPDGIAAATLYSVHGLVIAISYTLLWRHAAKGGRLLGRRISVAEAENIWRQFRLGPAFYVAAIVASQWNPYAGIAICAGLAVMFALPPRVVANHLREAEQRRALRRERYRERRSRSGT